MQALKIKYLVSLLSKSKTIIENKDWLSRHLKFANKVKIFVQKYLKIDKSEKRQRSLGDEE